MILRTCRRGLLARSQQILQKVQPAYRSRGFSTGGLSILPKKPLDGVGKFVLGSFCFGLATVGKVYYDFFQDEKRASLDVKHELQEPVSEKVDVEKVDMEKEYQEQLKSVEKKYENDLKEAQTKASDNEARAKQLEKEVEELKASVDEYAAKLQGEIKEEDNAHTKEDAGKIRLVNEITELKRQIENLGLSGTDLDKSRLLHKLAMVMGFFAFENAMLNGDPLEKEVEFFQQGADSLIIAAISSLPEDAIKQGSLTPAELQKRFVDSKPKLRELVSNSGSGDDANPSNPKENENRGIEAVFEQVESFIKEGKLTEAASVLEQSTEGSEGQAFAAEWAKYARLRASVEQVHNVLRAHAATITMNLA